MCDPMSMSDDELELTAELITAELATLPRNHPMVPELQSYWCAVIDRQEEVLEIETAWVDDAYESHLDMMYAVSSSYPGFAIERQGGLVHGR